MPTALGLATAVSVQACHRYLIAEADRMDGETTAARLDLGIALQGW